MASRYWDLANIREAAMNKLETSLNEERFIKSHDISLDTTNFKFLSNVFADETARLSQSDISTANFTQVHFNLLHDDDPAWRATDSLFVDFKQLISQYSGGYAVFELIQNCEQLCEDQVEILQKILQRGAPGQIRFSRTIEMLRLMQIERCTWRLIRMLYEDRLEKQPRELSDDMTEFNQTLSDLDVWNHLIRTNKEFREMRLVLNWCEQNASDSLDTDNKLNFFTDKTFQWENTLHRLSNKSTGLRTKPVATKLDPDVVTREGKSLDDQDAADETRLLQYCFSYVRAGQINKAIDLCAYCGQSWRAASFQAASPYHDPNLNVVDGDHLSDIVGNRNRDLWKSRCWSLCENVLCPSIERAVYGALCGNLISFLWACKSWEDNLWAYVTASSEYRYDSCLRKFNQRRLVELPTSSISDAADYGMKEIFAEIEASENKIIRDECNDPFHVLQKFIILDHPDLAIQFLHTFISKEENPPKHVLRFMAHVVIIFKLCDLPFQEYFANGILESYVNLLIVERRTPLIASYVSLLPKQMQTVSYAKFLKDIEDENEQRKCLDLADDAGLDVRSICVEVVQQIRLSMDFFNDRSFILNDDDVDNMTDVAAAFTSVLTHADKKLINSIKWLLFDPKLRGEAIRQANTIARIFLVAQNLSAIKSLFDLMPTDSVNLATTIWLDEKNFDAVELDSEQQNCVHEYLSVSAYLDAHESFSEWFDHFYRRKPLPPEEFGDDTTLTAEVSFAARAALEHKMKEYETNLQRWRKMLEIFTERVVKSLYNVLQFPDGGWLGNVEQGDDDDRRDALTVIRRRCIPLIVNMLLSIFKSVERYVEALQLADIVMSNERQLFKEFSSAQLKRLSTSLAQCSIVALDKGYDFVGYDKNLN